MGKREPSAQNGTTPHVTLRQAVRPVVVAHGILSNEQLAAGALAEEAANLVELTGELLRKLGRVHLLTAPAAVTAGPPKADIADRLVEAYGSAGMAWARVLSSVTKLAELLIDEREWETAAFLARVISQTGEDAVSEHIGKILFKAQADIRTHPIMTADEIRDAVARLRSLPENPERGLIINSRGVHLADSALAIAQHLGNQAAIQLITDVRNRAATLSVYPSLASEPNCALSEQRLFSQVLATLDLCGG